MMKSLDQILSDKTITDLALASNRRYGTAIFKRNGVEFISRKRDKVEAWIGGLDGTVADGAGSRRRTQLVLSSEGLAWHCSGNPKDHQIFCKHCVAIALAILSGR